MKKKVTKKVTPKKPSKPTPKITRRILKAKAVAPTPATLPHADYGLKLAKALHAGLKADAWGMIDPVLIEIIASDVPQVGTDKETQDSLDSLRRILDSAAAAVVKG